MSYRLAKEAQEVADRLIDEHHGHLQGVTVTAVFVDKVPTSKGREVWARAKKVGGLNAFLIFAESAMDVAEHYDDAPHDLFVVEVAEDAWNKLTEKGRDALIDETLCSCEIEWDDAGNTKLAVVGPDVSGWREVLKRHGLWREDLEEFVRAGAEQLRLDALEEAVDAATREGEERENLGVSITHNGRTVHTDTATLGRMAAGEVPAGVSS